MALAPRYDAPSRLPSPTTKSVQIEIHLYRPLASFPQKIFLSLPRTTGLGSTFATIRKLAAYHSAGDKLKKVDEESITEVRVDGIATSFKASPEQYGVSEGEVIELFVSTRKDEPRTADLGGGF